MDEFDKHREQLNRLGFLAWGLIYTALGAAFVVIALVGLAMTL